MKQILLAGATGYLGQYIAKELLSRSYPVRTIVRNPDKLKPYDMGQAEVIQAEITQPDSIVGCCENIDAVVSSVGITKQKDGLTYMDVDYQANMNLLEEAQQSGVNKFIYVSVLNGEQLRHLKICDAKERFVDQLKGSGMAYAIVRPNGFFSDMFEFYNMAKKGRAYVFGDGECQTNPIHGEDLAAVCVDAIDSTDLEINVGGPQTLTYNQMATLAFEAMGKTPKISRIPNWMRISTLKMIKLLSGSKVYGPIEFFMEVMAMDMVAPEYGNHTLKDYFTHLHQTNV